MEKCYKYDFYKEVLCPVWFKEEYGPLMSERHVRSQYMRKISPETPPFVKEFMEKYSSDMEKRGVQVDATELDRYHDPHWLCDCSWCLKPGYSAESMKYIEEEEERNRRWQDPNEYNADQLEAAIDAYCSRDPF
uniref:Uncharacterized protein n=1 Tax=Dunaliella tertiolecta TaxID=3047 RepID=A0A7S3R609_DUNTE